MSTATCIGSDPTFNLRAFEKRAKKLAAHNKLEAEVVKLRYFVGLTLALRRTESPEPLNRR
jgi:hypothetical protein